MSATVFLALFGVGLAVGLVSGLIGIGGGVLIVPFLYFFYARPTWSGFDVPAGVQAAIAHATSLSIIIPTALRGTWVYHRSGLVVWRTALPVALASVISATLGARLALVVPEQALKIAFGGLLVASGGQLVLRRAPRPRVLGPGRGGWRSVLTGVLVGALSAFLGVGGGLVAIPLLIYLVRLDVKEVAATSLAIIVFAAAAGTLTYIVSGLGAEGLPAGRLGYVHAVVALPILLGATVSVGWGARINQRVPARRLQVLFGGVFIVLGARMILENVTRM